MSIKYKLVILFLGVLLIPLFLVTLLLFHNYRENLQSQIFSSLISIREHKIKQIQNFITEGKKDLGLLSKFPAVTEAFGSLPLAGKDRLDQLAAVLLKDWHLVDFMLVDRQGKVIYVANPEHSSELGKFLLPQGAAIFEQAKNKICLSDIFLHPLSNNLPCIIFAGPCFDNNGALAGVLVYTKDLSLIYDSIQDTTGLGETGETLLGEKKDHTIIFLNTLRHDPQSALKRKVLLGASVALPLQQGVQGLTGWGRGTDYRGVDVIAAWGHIPETAWGLVAKIDTAEAFSGINKMKKMVIFVVSIAVLLVGVLVLAVSFTLAKPLEILVAETRIIGSGNLDHKVGLSRKDEIGKLVVSFEQMMEDLKRVTASRDDLDKLKKELERSNKDLEQFAFAASHDLQEPLRMISNYVQLIEQRFSDSLDEKTRLHMGFVVDGANRMKQLINGLLDYSRCQRGQLNIAKFNAASACEAAAKNLEVAIKENNAVVVHDALPEVRADTMQLMRVFQNLIANALKFHSDKQPQVRISCEDKGKEWLFCVADNGIGFEQKYAELIFVIFQRLHTKDKYGGMGIGLPLCKTIIERHGGRIWAEAKINEGAKFYFTLPK